MRPDRTLSGTRTVPLTVPATAGRGRASSNRGTSVRSDGIVVISRRGTVPCSRRRCQTRRNTGRNPGGKRLRRCYGSRPMSTRPATTLETFANPTPERDYLIRFDCPEFTCLCPKTGQPDFATILVEYVPDRLCVELKSWKLYLWSYRDQGAFHEAVTNQILDDLVAAISPRKLKVEGDVKVRGGITTTVVAAYQAPPASPGSGGWLAHFQHTPAGFHACTYYAYSAAVTLAILIFCVYQTSHANRVAEEALREDIARRERAERELETHRMSALHAAKMAALGEMSGNIAHEGNNPVAAIVLRAQRLRMLAGEGRLDAAKVGTVAGEIEATVF